jgi:SAM-dependent methyltransferase
MFDLFLHHFKPDRSTTVLDVGVTSDSTFRESNYFEQFYPYPQNITCVGTENGSYLVEKYAGLRFQQVRAGESLPFRDSEFDIVFSNAVVEHVGNRHQQAQFMNELCRVARAFFVTTPNRWFPVEHHTGLPLLHYLPGPLFRSLIRHPLRLLGFRRTPQHTYWRVVEDLATRCFRSGEKSGVWNREQPVAIGRRH